MPHRSGCGRGELNEAKRAPVDLDGHPRIVFGTVDMGCYEWVASTNDYDGDGMAKDAEEIADTDGPDPAFLLAFTAISDTNGITLTWIGGTQAWQYVECRSNLVSTTEQWVAIYTNTPATPVTNVLSLPGPPMTARLYRIRAER